MGRGEGEGGGGGILAYGVASGIEIEIKMNAFRREGVGRFTGLPI
jgi:hypothetical protein